MKPNISTQLIPLETLTSDAYRQLEHAASLKGLLKPFKGKGSWTTWRRWRGKSRRSYVA